MSTRNRSRAKRAEVRAKFVSPLVDWFNRQENEREQADLLRRCSASPLNPYIAEKRAFYATLPLVGFLRWFLISAIPVELSRHTEIGRTQTAVVMERLY